MQKYRAGFICLVLATLFFQIESQTPTESYPNSLVLNEGFFYLFWKYDEQNITFEVHANNSAWFIFGITSSYGFSDSIFGVVNPDLTGHISSRNYSLRNDTRSLNFNPTSNYIPLDVKIHDQHLIVKFTRKIKLSCDPLTANNVDITSGSIPIIFGSSVSEYNSSILDPDYNVRNLSSLEIKSSTIQLLNQANIVPSYCVNTNFPEPVFSITPTDVYTNYLDLKPGVFRFYWNTTQTDLIGEIHCKTNGWVGFGISPNGGMDKSDVIIGWISEGAANFTDRFIVGRKVIVDRNQDWKLLYAVEKEVILFLSFKGNCCYAILMTLR